MQSTFIVPGYGVPRDIVRDENYRTYLTVVFNTILTRTRTEGSRRPRIVFSGGPTDCFPPYRRREAVEMRRYFHRWQRTAARREIGAWRVLVERRSLSTLENLLFVRARLRSRNIRPSRLVLFAEATRAERIRQIAPLVFGRRLHAEIVAVDFDCSPLRYLPSSELQRREARALTDVRRALRSSRALAEHHRRFVRKIASLRAAPPNRRAAVIRQSWQA